MSLYGSLGCQTKLVLLRFQKRDAQKRLRQGFRALLDRWRSECTTKPREITTGILQNRLEIRGYHPRMLPKGTGNASARHNRVERNYCHYLRRCFAFDESFISHLRLNGFIFDFINGGRKRKEKRNRDAGGGWGAELKEI